VPYFQRILSKETVKVGEVEILVQKKIEIWSKLDIKNNEILAKSQNYSGVRQI